MGRGSIPSRGTKIPQAMWSGQKKKKKAQLSEVVTWQIYLLENWLWGCDGLSAEEYVSRIQKSHFLALWLWKGYGISLGLCFPTYLKNRAIEEFLHPKPNMRMK